MNLSWSDYVALAVTGIVLIVGLALTWQSYQQWLALEEMGGHMGGTAAMHGTHPLWYLLGTLIAVTILGGGYVAMRDQFVATETNAERGKPPADASTMESVTAPVGEPAGTSNSSDDSDVNGSEDGDDSDAPGSKDGDDSDAPGSKDGDDSDANGPQHRPERHLLDVLPEDERRILQPVIDSPGLTQIELRDRADFSKSKVSQTVSDLEKRGLLYREPQGRTYRVYPADDLKER